MKKLTVTNKISTYWTKELSGILSAESLHIEKPKKYSKGAQESMHKHYYFILSSKARHTSIKYSENNKLELSSVIIFLWSLILNQYQNENEVCLGIMFSDESKKFVTDQEYIGKIKPTLPLRAKLDRDMTFLKGSQFIDNKLKELKQFSDISTSLLLNLIKHNDISKIYTSTLTLHNYHDEVELQTEDSLNLKIKNKFDKNTKKVSLSLDVIICKSNIGLRIEWDANKYPGKKIRSLVHSLNYWLGRLGYLSDLYIEQICLVTKEEDIDLKKALNHLDKVNINGDAWCFGEFLRNVKDDDIAIDDGKQQLTYAQLRSQSLKLAGYLKGHYKLTKGDSIVLIGERSIESVIGICASWILGIAWCPIDSNLPKHTIDMIISKVKPKYILKLDLVFEVTNRYEHHVDERLLESTMIFESIAYHISTSGSTGIPKIVSLSVGGLINLIKAWEIYYQLSENKQNVLQLGSWSSDVFLGDFLKALITRGTLIICPDNRRIHLKYLTKIIKNHNVTLVESTPHLVLSIVKYISSKEIKPTSLKTLIVGSDVFRLEELSEFKKILWDNVQLYNGYGLSECTIESIVLSCRNTDIETKSGLCPLGVPLPGTIARIVDINNIVLPPGAIGELHIGGHQVAIGYLLGNGSLDVTKFYELDGIRYFRTGDLVRLNEEGFIEFYGRNDNQVKVRGYRIELGAIENVLLSYSDIDEVAVVSQVVDKELEIIAFIKKLKGFDETNLLKWLQDLLPIYALPKRIVYVKNLSRNLNGKINRAELKEKAENYVLNNFISEVE